jgi:hypothetical protein
LGRGGTTGSGEWTSLSRDRFFFAGKKKKKRKKRHGKFGIPTSSSNLIYTLNGGNMGHLSIERLQVNWSIIKLGFTSRGVGPRQSVLHPVDIVTIL